ncbi:hypothetical protein GOV14_06900 [Candidatus Pacearchaeota archaeon]|nr:hypothetical protein [Candidatus Pacearchaeota archaeon]
MGKIKLFFKGFIQGQKEFGKSITVLVNSIILTAVYIFGIGITCVFAKLFRKQLLELRLEKDKKSYWKDYHQNSNKMEDCCNQF